MNKNKSDEARMIPCKVKKGKTIAIGYMPGASVNGQPMTEYDEATGAPARYVMKGGETALLPENFFRRHVSMLELLDTTVDEFLERESALEERENSLNNKVAELEERERLISEDLKAKEKELAAKEKELKKELEAKEKEHQKELAAVQKELDKAKKTK